MRQIEGHKPEPIEIKRAAIAVLMGAGIRGKWRPGVIAVKTRDGPAAHAVLEVPGGVHAIPISVLEGPLDQRAALFHLIANGQRRPRKEA